MPTIKCSWLFVVPFACVVVALSGTREAFPQTNAASDDAVRVFREGLQKRNLNIGLEAAIVLRQRYDKLMAPNKKLVDEKLLSLAGQQCIANYVNAMRLTGVGDQSSPASIQDFDWTYLLHEDLVFASVKITAQEPGYVAMLKAGDLEFENRIPFEKGEERWLVVPIKSGRIALSLAGQEGAQTWAVQDVEPLARIELEVPRLRMSEGCVLDIGSQPGNARLFFNGKQYHSKTNVAVVRDPGAVIVLLRLEGYEDYIQEVDCGKGDNHLIRAVLKKKR